MQKLNANLASLKSLGSAFRKRSVPGPNLLEQQRSKVHVLDEARDLVAKTKSPGKANNQKLQNKLWGIIQRASNFAANNDLELVLDFSGLKAPNIELNRYGKPVSNYGPTPLEKFAKKLSLKFNNAELRNLRADYIAWANTDFSFANLKGAYFDTSSFEQVKFDKANMSKAKFSMSRMKQSSFSEADLYRANIETVNMDHVRFDKANLRDASIWGFAFGKWASNISFEKADLANAYLGNLIIACANFKQAILNATNQARLVFKGCDFGGISSMFVNFDRVKFEAATKKLKPAASPEERKNNFADADFSYSDFNECQGLINAEQSNLSRTNFYEAQSLSRNEKTWDLVLPKGIIYEAPLGARSKFANVNFEGKELFRIPDLRNAQMPGAILKSRSFRKQDLSGINLQGANLYGVNLTNTNLTNANLALANLRKAKLKGANLTNAQIDFAKDLDITKEQFEQTQTYKRQGMDKQREEFSRLRKIDPEQFRISDG